MQFREAAKEKDDAALLKIMSNYGMQYAVWWLACFFIKLCFHIKNDKLFIAGEEVVVALGSEVDRLENEIQELVPGIRHVDIEAHNPTELSPWFLQLLKFCRIVFAFFDVIASFVRPIYVV